MFSTLDLVTESFAHTMLDLREPLMIQGSCETTATEPFTLAEPAVKFNSPRMPSRHAVFPLAILPDMHTN